MKLQNLLPFVLLAACSSGPSKQESTQIFATTTSALTSAQSTAVADSGSGSGDLSLNYSGPCSLGGSISVVGSYNGDGTEMASFDLTATFDHCSEPTGAIDGDMHWTSTSSGSGFSAAMTGGVDWDYNNSSASCDFDVHMAVSDTAVSYTGSICGYDVTTDLTLTGY
jgi:hypothetical protein